MQNPDITMKQAAFIRHYIETDGDGERAAIMAGYSEKSARLSAYRNMHNATVLNALEHAGATAVQRVQSELDHASGSAEYVIRKLIEVVEGDHATRDRLTALSLLARRLTEWKEGPQVQINQLELPSNTSLSDLRSLAADLRESQVQIAPANGVSADDDAPTD